MVEGDVWAKVKELPSYKNLPQGVQQMNLGNQKWQAELLFNFAVALISGVLLVFAVLVLLYRRFLAQVAEGGYAGSGGGGGQAVLGEDRAEALDPLRRGAIVGAGRVVGDQVDLEDLRIEHVSDAMEIQASAARSTVCRNYH